MSKKGKRKFWKRTIVIVIIGFVSFLLVAVSLAYSHKDELIAQALDEFNSSVAGGVEIVETSISPFENFPYISVDLQGISVYEDKTVHTDTLVHIKDVYVGFDLWSILQGSYEVKKLKLSNGFVKLIQHTDGSLNVTNALSGLETSTDTTATESNPIALSLDAIELENIDLLKINEASNIVAEVFIENIESSFSMSADHIKAAFDSKMLFNLVMDNDTSFLHHKHLSLKTGIDYDLTTGVLDLDPSELMIEKASFSMDGTIDIANDLNLDLSFSGTKPNFDLFLAFVPEEFSPLLNRYNNGGTVYFDAAVKGSAAFGQVPHVEVDFGCAEAFVENIEADKSVNDLFFKGHFTTGERNELSSMALTLEDFTARPETGTFKGNISVKNFESPDIQMQVDSEFNLDFLTEFLEIENLQDVSGKVNLSMNFHDIIDLDDPAKAIERLNESYYTELKVENLNFTSPDFHLPFRDINIHAAMDGHEAKIDQFTLKTGNTDIAFTADISDLPAIIHHTDIPVDFHFDIKSNLIDILEITQTAEDSIGFNEQIKDLEIDLNFKSSARAFTESPNLPLGEFFINELNAQLTNYPHRLHDFKADIIVDSVDFRVIDFTGILDASDFHFNGKLKNYDLWFEEAPTGLTQIDFNLDADVIQLKDLFSYGGENYVPEDYREEEIQNLKLHGITQMKFDQKLHSVDLKIDKIEARMKNHGMQFEQFSGNIYVDSTHLEVTDFGGKLGNSEFVADVFYNLDSTDTTKAHSFALKSPKLDFDQLFSYAPPMEDPETHEVDHEDGFNVFDLPFSNMEFALDIDQMNYHKYLLQDFKLEGRMKPNHYIYVDTMALKAAGGAMRLNGYFNGSNPDAIYFSPNMELENVDLDQLLFKFDNFGQDQLISENLHGKLSGAVNGRIHMHPDLIPATDESELSIDIEVVNGSLQNFAAFEAMEDYFTDKNLNLVRFDTLRNTLNLKNGDLLIPKMNINTSLGYFEISGTQSLDTSMEYVMRIPLKVVARAGIQKLFGNKKRDNSDQVDEIQYRDENKRTRFITVTVTGNAEEYDVKLGKKRSRD